MASLSLKLSVIAVFVDGSLLAFLQVILGFVIRY
jgi:hypothetical protein